jgi:phage protein D
MERDREEVHINMERDREEVLNIMRTVEAEVNVGIISDALQNSAEAITSQTNRIEDENVGQHLVSSVIVNNVGEDLATMAFENLSENVNNVGEDLATMEFENLSENVNISELDERWRGEMVRRTRSNEIVSEDYLTTLTLPEDIIVIRYILYFPWELQIQRSTQIIWNSRFSWREIMQHLQENIYNFNFEHEIIIRYAMSEDGSSNAAEVVDGLRDREEVHINMERDREEVLNIMRTVEAEVNVGIISDALQNSAEAITSQTNRIEDENVGQHLVSSVIVNNVGEDLATMAFENLSENVNNVGEDLATMEFENLSENVNISELDERWRGEMVRRTRSNEIVSEDYLTTLTLPEDIIVIRYILYFPWELQIQRSTQIIWNSRFSWREIMQHLQENIYNFNFEHEIIIRYAMSEVGSSNAAEVVDGLRDVIIRWEDNANGDEVMCIICYDKFKNGESAKQLACNHLYHSHCLLEWFSRKISCPICRDEQLGHRQR